MTGCNNNHYVALELPSRRAEGEKGAAGPLHTHLFSFTWRMINMQRAVCLYRQRQRRRRRRFVIIKILY